MTMAFKSFALEASEKELDEALRGIGMEPESLISRADKAFESALATAKEGADGESNHLVDIEIHLHKGLSTLIRLLRKRDGLSEQQLADAANVDLSEIRQIETDERYSPSPRTIFQLEEYFKLPQRTLVLVSGSVATSSREFADEVLRFAAHSADIGGLSRAEKKLLNSFVQFLANEAKKRG
jgi:transcriptional regulator with XRE-family HTH domain